MKKKSIINLIDSLERAINVIGASKSPGSEEIKLLTKCQQTALLIGNELEKKYVDKEDPGNEKAEKDREGAVAAVHILEDYCESLYNLAESFASGGNDNNDRKIIKAINKYLANAKRTIEHEISPDRREVVFLPYKASMWDSLESLYKKEREKEDTDAFVIPIPYFEKNNKGELTTEHYEGADYPEDIPVTDYREYDFEENRPDEIYIHNPYDDRNYVTSVHPFFYSSNLKKFGGKLIYVPYFVLLEPDDPDNPKILEDMEKFVLLPGVLNSDKTIVQSEKMKKVYVNVLTNYMAPLDKEHTKEDIREFWEGRIDGSGSPKFEKIRNTRKEELQIPPEWEKLIKREDGSDKKIVLYNTGVSALLQNDEKMIDKIERTFKTFYENRKDIVLLWRPHPLMENTLLSMRPELYERYEKLKNDYINGAWGIYDDSPDMDRALVLSDAYFGDHSSLVSLYKETGKPIMIQNPDD